MENQKLRLDMYWKKRELLLRLIPNLQEEELDIDDDWSKNGDTQNIL